MPEQSGEIWATRVQKELLSLTADETQEQNEFTMMLPNFCTVTDHTFDTNGVCTVDFQAEIRKEDQNHVVVFTVDASLPKKGNAFDYSATAYPFVAPIVTLLSGQEAFPQGSTIQNGNQIAMDLDWTPSLHIPDAVMNISLKLKESILQGEPFHPAAEVAKKGKRGFNLSLNKDAISKAFSTRRRANKQKRTSSSPTASTIRIGDEINLLEEPWCDSHGVYYCKAIRRPAFIEDAIQEAQSLEDREAFASPTNMFRSFARSAKSVLEETFFMVTESHVIEMKGTKLDMSHGKVVMALPIDMMAKLKFRRGESISLFFKPAPDDPLVYMCPDSSDAVHQIQSVLKRHGVKGKHTNATAHRLINEAIHLVQEIQTKELALKHDPSLERVNDIMDLYRQAAERFEVAGDIRHTEVVTHMRKFLALPLTSSILDGSFKKPEQPSKEKSVLEGEVLERPKSLDDEDETTSNEKEKENDKAFEENIDSLLKEAQADVENFKLEKLDSADSSDDNRALEDVVGDLDAMMKKADQELADLMKA